MKKSIIVSIVLSVFLLNSGKMQATGALLKTSDTFRRAHALAEDGPLSDGLIVYYDNHPSWYTILVAYRATTALAHWESLSKEDQDCINAHSLTSKTLEFLRVLEADDLFVFFQLPQGQCSLKENDNPLAWRMHIIPDALFPLKLRKPIV